MPTICFVLFLLIGHQQLSAAKKNKRNPVQLLLSESTLALENQNEFLADKYYASVATHICLNKLQSTPFKNILQTFVNQNILDENILQKNY